MFDLSELTHSVSKEVFRDITFRHFKSWRKPCEEVWEEKYNYSGATYFLGGEVDGENLSTMASTNTEDNAIHMLLVNNEIMAEMFDVINEAVEESESSHH